jgi:hypothetical protein
MEHSFKFFLLQFDFTLIAAVSENSLIYWIEAKIRAGPARRTKYEGKSITSQPKNSVGAFPRL